MSNNTHSAKAAVPDETTLRSWAAGEANSCHSPGDPGYCNPNKARWTLELVDLSYFSHIWPTSQEARTWIDDEIKMAANDDLHRDWDKLLSEPIREEIVCLIRDGNAYIWDGWHRSAAAVATGRPVLAIVGRPMPAVNRSAVTRPKVPQPVALPRREPLCELPQW